MRKHFPGYYRPSDDDLKTMWDQGIFSFDANVLLNLYRYTPPTRDRLLEILDKIASKVWLTHQAALEFHRNRLEVITTQRDAYNAVRDSIIKKNLGPIIPQIRQQYSKHSAIDVGPMEQIVKETEAKLTELLNEAQKGHPDYLDMDPVLDRLTALFNSRVGNPYSKTELVNKHKDAKARFDAEVPPGYKDAKKPEPDRYGDVLVWFQLLDQAAITKKPVIFITDDKKEDWWRSHDGKTIGPRPELSDEMHDVAGASFYMYAPERFMAYAETYLGLPTQGKAIAEVRELSEQDTARISAAELAVVESVDESMDVPWLPRVRRARRPVDDWTRFWTWARQHGFTSRESLDRALLRPSGSMTPNEIRAHIEARADSGFPALTWESLWKWGRPQFDPLNIKDMWDLESFVGHSFDGMTPWELQLELMDKYEFAPF